MGHTYADILFHIVFSTKDRKPLLDQSLKPRLFAYMGGIADQMGGRLLSVNGPMDHVHLLVRSSASLAPASLVRSIKGGSSKWIHESFPERVLFAWQEGYAIFSVSQRSLPDIERYIQDQDRHHQKVSFEEELRMFLTSHAISFDERYGLG